MGSQDLLFQRFGRLGATVALLFLHAAVGGGQALHVEELPGGVEFVLVTLPLSDATTVTWPRADATLETTTSGALTLYADIEQALSRNEGTPPVVVAVGGAQVRDLRQVVSVGFEGRPFHGLTPTPVNFVEGGVERRLGAPGDEAMLRLEVAMPAPDDWRRSTIEVLWELLPSLVVSDLPGARSRIDGGVGLLEARVDAELADLKLRQLRYQLARISEDPRIDEGAVAEAAQRLRVRRQTLMGMHPESAEAVVQLWMLGGVAAVREFLFGVDGVTASRINEAARQWLPQHPGHAIMVLPPPVFNPRFAAGPERLQLANDVVATVLERSTASLSAVCLKPVLLPDVDGQLSGTVLTRLAAEIRSSDNAPGWVRVSGRPPVLELAAADEHLAELLEALQRGLERVAGDERQFAGQDPSSRRRALQLMARLLGLAEGVGMTPAELLQPSNLALGVVGPDSEAAVDALQKFSIGGVASASTTASRSLPPVPRIREAAPGTRSTLVIVAELSALGDPLLRTVVGEVIKAQAQRLLEGAEVDVLSPLVPGRNLLLVVIDAEATLDELEREIADGWSKIVEPPSEDELAVIRRRVAADLAAQMSGPVGHARRCAAVAAGSAQWRLPAELEMDALSVAQEDVAVALHASASFDRLQTTGAGVLPIPEADSD